jgi:hypothetical protein
MESPSAQLLFCRTLILAEVDEAQRELAAAATQAVLAWNPMVEMRGFVPDLERLWQAAQVSTC